MRTALLTIAALIGFAANSLLCRMALHSHEIDAASFSGIRLLSGAVVLAILARSAREGRWLSALALFAYAAAFSYAYLRLTTGTGALILFATVQISMVGWGWRTGERPRPLEWLGLALAFGGLIALTLPGLSAPDPMGAGLMALAGIAWGIYSIRGRGSRRPLAETAGNFIRSLPAAAVLVLLALPRQPISSKGALLAVASGALASGIGYSLWYAALPHLRATRAAIVQLAVPVLAAAAGLLFLGESPSLRLVLSGLLILVGIALALLGKRRTADVGNGER